VTTKFKLPKHDRKISDVIAENKASAKGISKRQVSVKLAEGADVFGEIGSTMQPSPEQLEKINRFTRVEATADNVVAFPVFSCNDLYDRDDERFTPRCIDEFAALEPPYSAVGKSYMTDHEYKIANARGRIFDVGVKQVQGVKFLTNEVYVPKTPQYADFIESIDFGLNWAVSVGVVIDAANCSICKGTVYSSGFFGSWCENGHEKGYWYVPGEEEEDGWGYYLPVDPSTKNAVKAMVDLSQPRDFYELSQVFLGAQYMAELGKSPNFRGMVKAASAAPVPVVGMSEKAPLFKIDFPKEPEQLTEARKLYSPETDNDGTIRWTDAQKLVWQFEPEDGSIGCLGRAADADDEDEEEGEPEDKSADALKSRLEALNQLRAGDIAERLSKASDDSSDDDDDDPTSLAEQLDAIIDEAGDAIDNEDYDQASDLLDSADTISDQLIEALGGTDADEENEGDDKNPETVALVRQAKLPDSIVSAVAHADADKVVSVLVSETRKVLRAKEAEIETLKPKAVLGETYVAEVEAEAIAWFTKSRLDPKAPRPVDVTLAQKLIARCGGDVELIKDLSKDWEAEAKRRFPAPRRRSTIPESQDPNEAKGPAEIPAEMLEVKTDPRVQHLHSK
jgi:hypothetical protein